jgi:hypothetical protein
MIPYSRVDAVKAQSVRALLRCDGAIVDREEAAEQLFLELLFRLKGKTLGFLDVETQVILEWVALWPWKRR